MNADRMIFSYLRTLGQSTKGADESVFDSHRLPYKYKHLKDARRDNH